jgi:hypothetical protein
MANREHCLLRAINPSTRLRYWAYAAAQADSNGSWARASRRLPAALAPTTFVGHGNNLHGHMIEVVIAE